MIGLSAERRYQKNYSSVSHMNSFNEFTKTAERKALGGTFAYRLRFGLRYEPSHQNGLKYCLAFSWKNIIKLMEHPITI